MWLSMLNMCHMISLKWRGCVSKWRQFHCIDGDSNDKPTAMQSCLVARSQCWTTVWIGTRSLITPMTLTGPITINPERSLLWCPGWGWTCVGIPEQAFSGLIAISTVNIIGVISDLVPIYTGIQLKTVYLKVYKYSRHMEHCGGAQDAIVFICWQSCH